MAFLPYLNYICSFFNKINIFSTGGQLPILVNYDQFLIFSQSEVSEVRGLDLVEQTSAGRRTTAGCQSTPVGFVQKFCPESPF